MSPPKKVFGLVSIALLTACATPANHYDPLEPINRPIYQFNNVADRFVLKPVAKTYVYITPRFIRKGVSNFYGNIDDLFTVANGALQGKGKQAGSDALRVLLNTTVGIAGLFDVASPMGLEKHDEDIGQTLGYWGLGSGPYLVIPFLGPSTARDVTQYPVSFTLSPVSEIKDAAVRNSLTGLKIVDTRAQLLDFDALIADAIDPYSFVRDSYLQQRYNKVWDGNPPMPLKLSDDAEEDLQDENSIPVDVSGDVAPPVASDAQATSAPASEVIATPVQ